MFGSLVQNNQNDLERPAEFYLKKYAGKYQKRNLKISEKAKRKLLKHTWPGNVRELQHSIEKAVILSDHNILDENSFTLNKNIKNNAVTLQSLTIEEMEKQMIINTIDKEKGNMSAVSKTLGITRQTLYNKLKKYGI